jgi:hypothetical protein
VTAKEIKSEIQKALGAIPANVLEEVLSYLKEVKGKSAHEVELDQDLRRILAEDKELLQRLAK